MTSKLDKIPFLTIGLITLSAIYFVTVNKPPSNRLLEWIINPIIHADSWHLIGNVITLGIAGSLVELWVCADSKKERFKSFLIVYGINQAITIRRWVAQGEPSIGLSLFIYAFMGMAVYNYSNSQFSNGLRKWEKLAPIAIGFLLAIAFIDFLTNSVQLGLISAIFADWQHLLAFGFGVVAFHFQKIQNRA